MTQPTKSLEEILKEFHLQADKYGYSGLQKIFLEKLLIKVYQAGYRECVGKINDDAEIITSMWGNILTGKELKSQLLKELEEGGE